MSNTMCVEAIVQRGGFLVQDDKVLHLFSPESLSGSPGYRGFFVHPPPSRRAVFHLFNDGRPNQVPRLRATGSIHKNKNAKRHFSMTLINKCYANCCTGHYPTVLGLRACRPRKQHSHHFVEIAQRTEERSWMMIIITMISPMVIVGRCSNSSATLPSRFFWSVGATN